LFIMAGLSAKSKLNEVCQTRKVDPPVYDTKFQGPPHARLFQSTVAAAGVTYVGEECTTKKASEQSAAEVGLNALRKYFEEQDKLQPPNIDSDGSTFSTGGAQKRRFSDRGRGRGFKRRRGGGREFRNEGEVTVTSETDQRLAILHQQMLPEVSASTAVASLIHTTNEHLGTLREAHKLVEFKLTGAYAQGLLTNDDLNIDAAVILGEAPTKKSITDLATALKPLYKEHKVYVQGSKIIISNDSICLNLATTFLGAWQAVRTPNRNHPAFVDVDACQNALLSIRQVLWFDPNFLNIFAPNPRIVAKLFRKIVKKHKELQIISPFDQLVLIYWSLKYPRGRYGLSSAIRQIFAYLASGTLYPGGDEVVNPVKDYKVHLFSKITPQEELKLAQLTREYNAAQSVAATVAATVASGNGTEGTEANPIIATPVPLVSPELENLMKKAIEPDPKKIDPLVAFAEKVMRLLAYDVVGWEKLCGGLPVIPVPEPLKAAEPKQPETKQDNPTQN